MFLVLPRSETNVPKYDAVSQAKTFIRTVGTLDRSDFPPSLDVEIGGGLEHLDRASAGRVAQKRLEYVRAAWKTLKDFYKVPPIIYTSFRIWQEELLQPQWSDLAESPLWIKDYPFKKGPYQIGSVVVRQHPPRIPPPWAVSPSDGGNWWIHQYQGDAVNVPGFSSGNVDMNRFRVMLPGEGGDRVKWTQRRLGIAPTGVFDSSMEAALRAFQQRNGLAANAVIDPRTFASLCWSNP